MIIRDEKLKFDINREAIKISSSSSSSSGKIGKNECLTGEETSTSDFITNQVYLFSCKKSVLRTLKQLKMLPQNKRKQLKRKY